MADILRCPIYDGWCDTMDVPKNSAAANAELEITPEMIEAGANAVTVCLDECSLSFCELVAVAVYRAMHAVRD